jgi:hypothetical protein
LNRNEQKSVTGVLLPRLKDHSPPAKLARGMFRVSVMVINDTLRHQVAKNKTAQGKFRYI